MQAILDIPLTLLSGTILDLARTPAQPQRYRLIDCARLTQDRTLCLYETSEFPDVPYSALSYVWQGNGDDPYAMGSHLRRDRSRPFREVFLEYGSFNVAGAEGSDPISIDLLLHASTVALHLHSGLVWLDRLCILQTSKEDKAWQISRMYQIYRDCRQCIVLPGGIRRLVYLNEETAWIHRAWTLQEVLAPKEALVLFAWTLGAGEMLCGDEHGRIEDAVPGQSATAEASRIVDACNLGYMEFRSDGGEGWRRIGTRILGRASPGLAALGVAMSAVLSADPDTRGHAIWKSALMRTSSRPVDMVFSIMGLFGVSLDPGRFGKDDRLHATVRLAQEILRSGGRATWLGVSLRLPPCPQLGTFPVFPQTSVGGKALVEIAERTWEVEDLMDSEYPNTYFVSMPSGSMDDSGCLRITAKAVCAIPVGAHAQDSTDATQDAPAAVLAKDQNDMTWSVGTTPGSEYTGRRAYAVALGWFCKYYPGATLAANTQNFRLMVLEEGMPDQFWVKSYIELEFRHRSWIKSWKEHTFNISCDVAGVSGEIDDAADLRKIERATD
ncbi:hypothetical protein WOLCODRAFT_79221 [Wolfiporia cocos MD-104 SS10]|uniref:Heterokaryon incompatibility domain-containing protein n=1 Tax=Wolfiporia cocos (strain MD-104) TaxID=742152 RepID=A0A2H3IZL4_WOLCO|nr:hypothetical protein WOLCODRAFT_79221 [Wolfiporia cocos MD-104 SS10]